MANQYEVHDWQKDMLNQIHSFVLENLSWIGVDWIDPSSSFEEGPNARDVRVLDYACGPGTITNILYSHATEFVGVDLAEKMVETYNARFSGSDAPVKAQASVGNLIDAEKPPSSSGPAGLFDLVAVGLGFHHFEDLALATSRLTSYLKPKGIFLIIDLVTHAPEQRGHNPAAHTVAHHGFREDVVKDLFGKAGLADVEVKVMSGEVLMRGTTKRKIFMARGRKAA